jgi:D-ribose pyranase
MKEVGILNRSLAKVITEQGHQDLLMVSDAGFAIPQGVETIDISLSENNPMVIDVPDILKNFYSVEKLILAKQTKDINPTYFTRIINISQIRDEREHRFN